MGKSRYCLLVITLLITSFSVNSAVCGDSNISSYSLEEWRKVEPPSGDDERKLLKWREDVNTYEILWEVRLNDKGHVFAVPYSEDTEEGSSPCKEFEPPQNYRDNRSGTGDYGWPSFYEKKTRYYKVYDGWLVGFFNRFNGELWWCSSSKEASYKVSRSKVSGFVEGLEVGEVYVIDETFEDENPLIGRVDYIGYSAEGVWEKRDSIVFPSKIKIGRKFGDVIYFIGSGGDIYSIDKSHDVEEKMNGRGWHVVHPKAMIKTEDYIYVGARKYVTRIDLKSWEVTYFSPN